MSSQHLAINSSYYFHMCRNCKYADKDVRCFSSFIKLNKPDGLKRTTFHFNLAVYKEANPLWKCAIMKTPLHVFKHLGGGEVDITGNSASFQNVWPLQWPWVRGNSTNMDGLSDIYTVYRETAASKAWVKNVNEAGKACLRVAELSLSWRLALISPDIIED